MAWIQFQQNRREVDNMQIRKDTIKVQVWNLKIFSKVSESTKKRRNSHGILENDQRMAFLRSHLCHPYRAYFTCRIAAFVCCSGCDFPGRWIEFGHSMELHMDHAANWLGIQVASLERNWRSSGFRLISSNANQKTRLYMFPSHRKESKKQDTVKNI
mgnify:FL=1